MPTSKMTSEQINTDLSLLEPAVDGLYTSWRGSKTSRPGFVLNMCGIDETKQGMVQMTNASQAGLDKYDGALNGTSPQVSESWYSRWPVINSAARSIRGLEMLAEQETDEAQLKKLNLLRAHACFVRAVMSFETTMLWGEVPVIEIEDFNARINMARQPLDVVWKQIFDDLTFAAANLEDGRQTDDRARKGAAIAMLGKIHMYAPVESGYRDFAKAITYFDQIKSTYSLHGNFAQLFDEFGWLDFNSDESIFEIDYDPNNARRSGWMWDFGSRTLADRRGGIGTDPDGNRNPGWGGGEGCYMGGYEVVVPTEYAHKMKDAGGVWEEGDLRRAASIREDYTYYTDVNDLTKFIPAPTSPAWMADELEPHVKKWEDRRIDQFAPNDLAVEATNGRSMYRSGKNYMYLRYGDILLCYAECLNETGKSAEAMAMVNQVRARAWGGTLPADKQWSGLSQEQFRVQIMDERIRELCFENWRRMDLIRTGMYVQLVKERNPWTKESGLIKEHHVRWPIPEDEIKNNPDMEMTDQNPGY
jgi:hypothetical protein